jgi:enhancer of filamentation 1
VQTAFLTSSLISIIYLLYLFFSFFQVLTPQKCGDVYLYDLLPTTTRGQSPYQNLSMMSSDSSETYDTPKPALHINYDAPRAWNRTPTSRESRYDDQSYDIPRPVASLLSQNLTPSSSNSSLLTSDSLSLSSSNRSSLANMPDYDIPRKHPTSIRSTPPPSMMGQSMMSSTQSTYDIPHAQNQNTHKSQQKVLPLELSSALETLAKLQNEATLAVAR